MRGSTMSNDKRPSLLAGLMAKKGITIDATPVTESTPKDAAPAVKASHPNPLLARLAAKTASAGVGAGGALAVASGQAGGVTQTTGASTQTASVGGNVDTVSQGTSGDSAKASAEAKTQVEAQKAKPAGLLGALAVSKQRAEQAKVDHDYLFDEIPAGFQDVLDRFDSMMLRDQGAIDFDLPHLRNYVQRIMVDLKENPEYVGMFVDRDAHNVIKWMRRVKGQALEIAHEKVDKASKKSTKPKASQRFDMDLGNLDLMASKPKPKSIQDLSSIDFGDLS